MKAILLLVSHEKTESTHSIQNESHLNLKFIFSVYLIYPCKLDIIWTCSITRMNSNMLEFRNEKFQEKNSSRERQFKISKHKHLALHSTKENPKKSFFFIISFL